MRSLFKILIPAALLTTLTPHAKTLRDAYKTPLVRQEQSTTTDQTYDGLDPLVGRNVISVLVTDIFNLFVAPNMTSLVAVFFDFFNFVFMPIVGGLVMASISYNYDQDYITYQHAKMNKTDMYAS